MCYSRKLSIAAKISAVVGLVLVGLFLLTLLWAAAQTRPEYGLLVVLGFYFAGVPGLVLTTIGGVLHFLSRRASSEKGLARERAMAELEAKGKWHPSGSDEMPTLDVCLRTVTS